MLMLVVYVSATLGIATVNALTINGSSLTLPSLRESNLTDLGIPFDRICTHVTYGGGISPESCADALLQINASDPTQQTYAERFTAGPGPAQINLPRRYISGDGRCTIDLRLARSTTGLLSPQRLAFGLLYIVDECVRAMPALGGIVRNMGGDDHVSAQIDNYEPDVDCAPHPPMSPNLQESCQNILDNMPASHLPIVVEPAGSPGGVQTLLSEDRRCNLTIWAPPFGRTDYSTWNELWKAGVALNGICVRSGRSGTQSQLGIRRTLSVVLTPGSAPST